MQLVCYAPCLLAAEACSENLNINCESFRATAAAESAIERDPVDRMIRDALKPVVDPFIAYLYRTPATAEVLKPLIGEGTPLV